MWEYKVIAGVYSLDGADVVVENPLGRGTLQRILDHYGSEGFELASTHYDNINKELVVLLKKPKGGVVVQQPVMMGGAQVAAPAAPAAAAAPEPEPPAAGGRRRRSRADLDRLARD